MATKLTQKEVIRRAKTIFPDYDYSKVNYVNSKIPITIICPIHGEFQKTFDTLVYQKQGCSKCSKKFRYNTETFIQRAKEVHGDKYDYSKIIYKGNKEKVCIICSKHGDFWQTPDNHLNQKQGCPKCGNNTLTYEEFLEEANKVWQGKFTYKKESWKGNKSKIGIICPIHGTFYQRADHHLKDFTGCPKCKGSGPEQLIINWLDAHKIEYVFQKKFADCKDVNPLPFDFYIPSKNLLIEYQGEQHYSPMRYIGTDFHLLKHHDWLKRKYCKKRQIKLLTISYKDCKIIDEILRKNICEF